MAAEWSPEMSREMQRAGANIGKRSPESQPKAGRILSSSATQPYKRRNMRGGERIEQDKLWISASPKETTARLSVSREITTHRGRGRGRVK
jgi:hypothetical protein